VNNVATKFLEIESVSAFNTAVAASGSEILNFVGTARLVQNFNKLNVLNRDVVPVRVDISGGAGTTGRVLEISQNGGSINITPEDGIVFSNIKVTNLDGSTAETANKILFRAAYAIPV